MKGVIVRVCAWFTLIIYGLTSIVGLGMMFTEKFNVFILLVPLLCLLISATGWNARKFGLSGFRAHIASKAIAVVVLILAVLWLTLFPVFFTKSFGLSDSLLAIRNLLILFIPVAVSSIAILISKSTDLKNSI